VRSARLARWSTAIGLVIAIAGAVFVVRAIADQWTEVRDTLGDADVGWLVAAVVVAASAMVAVALPWRRALGLVGQHATLRRTLIWYFMGEIGKYVPGGIWPVLGRGELARRGGHARAPAYASVALSLGALYLSAMLVSTVLLPLRFADDGDTNVLWVLVLLPVGLLLLHHRVLEWLIARGERLMKRDLSVQVPPWSASLGLVACYVPAWLLIGSATWCAARAFAPSADWLTIAPAAILSWVVGFVLVPVPGGVGVREAAFVALVGSALPSGTSATIAIVARLAFMLVDAAGAGIGAAFWRGDRPRTPRPAAITRPTSEP
jgi:uncharacterized membrane protein YbhN (UPF0104 family)